MCQSSFGCLQNRSSARVWYRLRAPPYWDMDSFRISVSISQTQSWSGSGLTEEKDGTLKSKHCAFSWLGVISDRLFLRIWENATGMWGEHHSCIQAGCSSGVFGASGLPSRAVAGVCLCRRSWGSSSSDLTPWCLLLLWKKHPRAAECCSPPETLNSACSFSPSSLPAVLMPSESFQFPDSSLSFAFCKCCSGRWLKNNSWIDWQNSEYSESKGTPKAQSSVSGPWFDQPHNPGILNTVLWPTEPMSGSIIFLSNIYKLFASS